MRSEALLACACACAAAAADVTSLAFGGDDDDDDDGALVASKSVTTGFSVDRSVVSVAHTTLCSTRDLFVIVRSK
jgi:hypothetical protein